MRTAFINKVVELAESNQKVNILAGDLGYGVLDQFKEKYPNRFLNSGVSEQMMTGIATGMALEGETVLTYSIANFPTFRCLEQIRNDVCYHNADVKIVSVGAGVAYGTHGYTHFGVEDLAVMRCLPNMKVVCPADPVEAQTIAEAVLADHGPTYVRLGKNREPVIHELELEKKIGSSYPIKWGTDAVILSSGSITYHAKEALALLSNDGHDVGLISVPWISPFDTNLLKEIDERGIKKIFTLEEHGPTGGLYSTVLEELSRNRIAIPVVQFSLPSLIDKISPQNDLLKAYGLTKEGLYSSIVKELSGE